MRKRITIVLLLVLLTGLVSPSCKSMPEGRIVFTSNRSGAFQSSVSQVYTMNADGNNVVQLTFNEFSVHHPAWSPDGMHIAFDSIYEGRLHIYVMNANGSDTVRLTSEGGGREPAWSPDGTRIAFVRNDDIYVMSADGSDEVRLTRNLTVDLYPAWSPDGRRIAYACRPYKRSQICVMDVDGGNKVILTDQESSSGYPAWSPDGTRIAFASSSMILGPERVAPYDIFVMNSDGTSVVQLIETPYSDKEPSWSPDGRYIVFVCVENRICLIPADGGQVVQLTGDEARDFSPDWSP